MSKNIQTIGMVVAGVIIGAAVTTKVIKTIRTRKNKTEEVSK